MSSRADEKERRRQERLAAEQAAAKGSATRKRLGLVLGGVLAAAIAVVVVLAITGGGSDSDPEGTAPGNVALPAVQIDNLNEAAEAAGCEVEEFRATGDANHTSEDVEYEQNPPTSGPHDPVASREGVYGPGNPPDLEQSVHALEHGRINIQYKKGTPENQIEQFEALFEEEVRGIPGYMTLVFENQTGMEPAVAATSWGKMLSCPAMNDRVFDALRAFRNANVAKGPERVPSEFEGQ